MHARQASILETLRAVQTDDVRLAHMKPIAEVAKARLRAVPEMHAFALPVATPSSTRLVALAGAMGDAAVKHEAVFVDAGLPEDFIAQLNTAAAVLRDSLSAARRASAERSVRRTHSPR